MFKRHLLRCVLASALGGLLAAPVTVNAQADLDALIKAAKAEGEVIFYSGATENVAKRVAEAYKAKYGIKYAFTRLWPG